MDGELACDGRDEVLLSVGVIIAKSLKTFVNGIKY